MRKKVGLNDWIIPSKITKVVIGIFTWFKMIVIMLIALVIMIIVIINVIICILVVIWTIAFILKQKSLDWSVRWESDWRTRLRPYKSVLKGKPVQKVAFRLRHVDLIMNVSACEMGLWLLAENNFPIKPNFNFLPRIIDAKYCNGCLEILRNEI